MRYICGNPWDDKDPKVREGAGRPVVNHDELNQYVNQADPHAFDQEITLGAIPNPDSVLYCPDTKQPDWSDAE